jgi:predicted DNA-binding transcriptional regulator AlpA
MSDTDDRRSPPDLDDIRAAVREELRAQSEAEHRREAAPEPLMTKADVAEALGVTERTVDTISAAGDLPKIKVRGCVRFAPGAVEAYIQRQTKSSQ